MCVSKHTVPKLTYVYGFHLMDDSANSKASSSLLLLLQKCITDCCWGRPVPIQRSITSTLSPIFPHKISNAEARLRLTKAGGW